MARRFVCPPNDGLLVNIASKMILRSFLVMVRKSVNTSFPRNCPRNYSGKIPQKISKLPTIAKVTILTVAAHKIFLLTINGDHFN